MLFNEEKSHHCDRNLLSCQIIEVRESSSTQWNRTWNTQSF